jgi:hypothetical protein
VHRAVVKLQLVSNFAHPIDQQPSILQNKARVGCGRDSIHTPGTNLQVFSVRFKVAVQHFHILHFYVDVSAVSIPTS